MKMAILSSKVRCTILLSTVAVMLVQNINGFVIPSNTNNRVVNAVVYSNINSNNDDNDGTKETPLEKAIRKAKAKAEIKRLTSGPEGILDLEGELKKVTSMGDGILEASNAVEVEERVSGLEGSMANAVKAGDFKIAAEKRDELNRMHLDDCGLVLQANSAFYRAFSDKDLLAMKETWLQNESIEIIQPDDGSPIRGYTKVQEWFKELFALEDNLAVRLNTIQPTNVRLNVKGTTAWVSCDEEIYAPKFVRGLGSTRKLVGKLTATNLFRKINGRWLLAHHHATWLSEEYNTSKKDYSWPNPALRLMGNFKQPSSTAQPSGTVKKVVMGSLSDILNGGLSDILGPSSSSSSKSNDDEEFKTIIHLSSPLDDDDDDELDDDDDQDSLLSKWAKLGSGSTGGSSKAILPSSLTKKNNNNYDDQAALRQGCIQTLRKLCVQGSLSHNQKRLLLTDIISCSTKGQNSMVEVAFDLLLVSPNNAATTSASENNDSEDNANAPVDEDGEEEFADQCRVLADSLLEKSS